MYSKHDQIKKFIILEHSLWTAISLYNLYRVCQELLMIVLLSHKDDNGAISHTVDNDSVISSNNTT